MNQFSQKRLWAGLVFILFLGTAQAQISNLTFFIQGPEVVCPGTCDTFSVVTSQPNPGGSGVVITDVTWFVSNGQTAQGNPALFCFDIPGATYILSAFGTASVNGTPFSFQTQPYPVFTLESCGFNFPFQITSNASSLCAANLPPPPVSPPPTGFALLLSDINGASPGQIVCMDMQVQNFFNMSAMSFSMQYDPARLQFVSMANVGLPGSTTLGLPEPPNSGTTTPGTITVNWSSPDQALTLDNGAVLFRICFTVLSGSGCSTDVVFSAEPTPIRVLRGNGEIVPFNSRPGRVHISNSSMGGDPNSDPCCEKVCEGAVVQYNVDLSTGAIHPVTWSVLGAQSYTVNNGGYGVEVVWGAAGSGSVFAAVYDNTASVCVDILAIPEAGFTTNPPVLNDTVRLCRGQSLAFTNTSTGAESYRWEFGDGTSSTELNPVHDYADAGLYRVALITYNECLCTDTAFVMVQVDPAIAPQVTCRGTVCEGTAVTYTTDADCGTFAWTVSANGTITDGGGPADRFITIDWAGGQEGIITLQVSNCNNATYCPAPNELRVPVISESAQISGPEQVCRAQSAKYSITRFEGSEFTWSVSGMGNIQIGQGTHEVVVEWSGLLSTQPQWVAVEYYNCYLECGGRDTIVVNIRPEFAVAGPVEACLNSTQNYTSRRTDNGANVPCNWEAVAGDGSVVWTSAAATAAPSVTWNAGPGLYRLVARPAVQTDFCIPLYEIKVRVLDLPPALANINGENVICPGRPYQYSGGGALPAHTLSWSLTGNTGPATLSGNPVTVQWAAAGPYTLSVRQISPQGCVSPPLGFGASVLPSISISGPTDACDDARTSYTATSFPQLDYQWSVLPADAGTIYQVGNGASVEILWHRPGAATLQLAVCGQNISQSVTVHARPNPMVTAPASVCEGATAMVSEGGAYAAYE
ncbi:MAG: PKD domain-containing protein, partial [Saprospiraceae bacterium]|nr:PKD domain-containing protein [Saprospiraceae bacterium]